MKIQSTPGATFDHMAGDIMRSQPCDIMFIAGGVNDADSLDDVELARAPLRKAIYQAKLKAKKVIVMSPPPLVHPGIRPNIMHLSDIMAWEAYDAQVEFVDASEYYKDHRLNGLHLFDRKGLHVNKLGGGIYAFALLDHLASYHQQSNVNMNFCVYCHHTGHTYDTCQVRNQRRSYHQPSNPRQDFIIPTTNRFDPLTNINFDSTYYI